MFTFQLKPASMQTYTHTQRAESSRFSIVASSISHPSHGLRSDTFRDTEMIRLPIKIRSAEAIVYWADLQCPFASMDFVCSKDN